jgi:hypothetical protein
MKRSTDGASSRSTRVPVVAGCGLFALGMLGLVPASPRVAPAWSIVSTPNAILHQGWAVSCASDKACTTVGDHRINTGEATLAEGWNGTGWVIESTQTPTAAYITSQAAVSCTSSTMCMAVGRSANLAETQVTLAENWNGTKWVTEPTPTQSGVPPIAFLSGVSCTTGSACTAVGWHYNSLGIGVTTAEVWNGTKWVLEHTPNRLSAEGSGLSGVSCPSTTACTAVGVDVDTDGTPVTLAEVWNGTKWLIQPTPNRKGAKNSTLAAVSCTSATNCTAVGYYINAAGTEVTLAETWNGTTWVIQTTPNPTGATSSSLSGVSCTSATDCTAVGNYLAGRQVTLAEAWNGTTWVIQTTPNPTGARSSSLSGVSCSSAVVCTAVGTYRNSGDGEMMLVERYS